MAAVFLPYICQRVQSAVFLPFTSNSVRSRRVRQGAGLSCCWLVLIAVFSSAHPHVLLSISVQADVKAITETFAGHLSRNVIPPGVLGHKHVTQLMQLLPRLLHRSGSRFTKFLGAPVSTQSIPV